MFVQKIRIHHFKSIYDPLELDFEKISGFWKIGGAVGVGKTTIGEAIIFGLFGSVTGKNNGHLISWGCNHGLVEMWCQSKNHNIYIRRELNKYGQSPMYATIDGEELIYTNKADCQAQLENEYYDVSRRPLELLCLISFDNFKSLAKLNPAETRGFLDQILNFEVLTQYTSKCSELTKNVSMAQANVVTKVSSNRAQIGKIQEISNVARISGDVDKILDLLTEQKEQLKRIGIETEKEREPLNKEYNETNTQLQQVKALGMNKKKEIDFIKKGTCPTCGAPIDQSQLEIKEQERIALLDQYNMLTEKLKEIVTKLNIQNDASNKRHEEQRAKIRETEILLTKLKEQEKRVNINTDEIGKLEKENAKLEKEYQKYEVELTEWNELSKILSSDVRTKVLSSFIPALNKNILKYTQQLKQKYIVTFDTQFKCSIKICGMDEDIPITSLSTGQTKTINMCIIMGMLGTILGNISFNITFLDELFSNMDADLRHTMCSVLRQNQQPRHTTFVITHTDINPRYFDGAIELQLQYFNEVNQKSVYTIEKYDIPR